MKVRLTTFVAGTDDEGTEAVVFGFEPGLQHSRGRTKETVRWVNPSGCSAPR